MAEFFVGLMSGTSLDGVDGVLADFSTSQSGGLRVVAHAHRTFDPALRAELLALNVAGDNELHRAALAGNALSRLYAKVVDELLQASGVAVNSVQAIGAHGQTVRHRPGEFDSVGYTLQLINPALLAELSGVDVIADFRNRDLAAGGQGAPLVPAFHRAVFARAGETIAVLNVGGISNLTVLGADGTTLGFDCGPGNGLMDLWCLRHTGRPFDDAGAWAAAGQVIEALLILLLAEPYFALTPPTSTGRDLLNARWLDSNLAQYGRSLRPVDVQATLAELTARICANDAKSYAAGARELLVCGGGAFNAHFLQRLATHLPGVNVMPSNERGLPADQVEACAFAWLARAFVRRENSNLPSVTGAAGPRLLGALYPAG
jgi:anhydro-N-acetylmuramic acid kinase